MIVVNVLLRWFVLKEQWVLELESRREGSARLLGARRLRNYFPRIFQPRFTALSLWFVLHSPPWSQASSTPYRMLHDNLQIPDGKHWHTLRAFWQRLWIQAALQNHTTGWGLSEVLYRCPDTTGYRETKLCIILLKPSIRSTHSIHYILWIRIVIYRRRFRLYHLTAYVPPFFLSR